MAEKTERLIEGSEKVTVFIPRKSKYDNERYVAVNGDNMLIQTGKAVEIPAKFAEVINASIRQDEAAEAYIAMTSSN